jgi:hypothetical protein
MLLESNRSQRFSRFHWQDDGSAAAACLRLHQDQALPGHPLQRLVDPELSAVDINVIPLKAERLTESHPSADRQHDQALNRLASRRVKEFLRLFG